MADQKIVDGKYLMYKDKPLVREGDTICYGDMTEKCILVLEIMSYTTVGGEEIYYIPNPALGLWINREKFED